ncbi:YecA family protein [Mesobacillus maritimus]|uniref:YecA family protein n=1 Tax=Mesobacillus maritimus TaxID=1643336 RepID=UPI00384C5A53
MNIGRNDDCPCGSGKKYKKCCLNKVVSMDEIIGKELNQLQEQLYEYFEQKDAETFYSILDNYFPEDEITEEEGILLTTLLILWATLEKPFMNKTLVQQFIEDKRRGKQLRPAVIAQLEKWDQIPPSFSKITKMTDGNWMEVEDVATKEIKRVKVFDNAPKLEVGMSLLGFLLPYGSYYSYFLLALHFGEGDGDIVAETLSELYEESDYNDFAEFLTIEFPYILNWVLFDFDPVEELRWDDPTYFRVVDLFAERATQDYEYSHQLLELGAIMWNIYCLKEKPSIRKPEVYAAALHYFIDTNIPGLGILTQKELAERYVVSATALSKSYRKMEERLNDEVEKLDHLMEKAMKDEMLNRAGLKRGSQTKNRFFDN